MTLSTEHQKEWESWRRPAECGTRCPVAGRTYLAVDAELKALQAQRDELLAAQEDIYRDIPDAWRYEYRKRQRLGESFQYLFSNGTWKTVANLAFSVSRDRYRPLIAKAEGGAA